MARKMGLLYDRIDVSGADSQSDGAKVPTDALALGLRKMIQGMLAQPTCVIPSVVDDPYLELAS